MHASFRIDVARRLVIATVSGDFTAEEVIAMAESIAAHPDFDPKFDELMDVTRLERFLDSGGDMEAIASKGLTRPSLRLAIVVSRDTSYGLARMYQSLAEGRYGELRIFRSMSAARDWLGIDR